jgi:thymidylate synthase
MKPGQLIGQLGDCHLYNNHLEQSLIYLDRPQRVLPELYIHEGIYMYSELGKLENKVFIPELNQIKLINYNPYPAIKAELSVGK